MTRSTRHRGRTRLLAAGAVAAAVATSAGAVGVAVADTAPASPSLVAAVSNVTGVRYVDGKDVFVDLDLGTYVIAGSDPIEIRVARKSYADPIVAHQIIVKDGVRTPVPLPAGLVTDFGGLKKFTTITLKDTKGKTVKSYNTDFCPNDSGSARTRRDAPANTPYPQRCAGENPFTLGAVHGIQAGWNASISSVPQTAWPLPALNIPAGKYGVTVTINPQYRDLFKIPAGNATVQLSLTVKQQDVSDDEFLTARRAAHARATGLDPAAAATEHGRHAGEGDPKRQLSSFSPEFRPPARRPAAVAADAIPPGPRPDLRSLPAWGITLEQGSNPKNDKPDGRWYLNFGATVWNAGDSPLLVDGFRRPGTELMDAYQYFFDAGGEQVGSVNAGTMEWDKREGHQHWHFTDFAQYRLLRADKTVAVNSGKESFCLVNTDDVDYTLPNAKWRPENTDLSSSCGQNSAVAVREVLDVGNGDTYNQDRPGQSFEVTNLPNGTYYIEVLANPSNKLTESSVANNSALRRVVLGGTKTNRQLTVPAHWGIKG